MRLRLLDMLACPRCRGELEVVPEETARAKLPEGFEPRVCSSRCAYHERGGKLRDCHPCYEFVVEEGRLECRSCAEHFEIKSGVPRLLVVEGPEAMGKAAIFLCGDEAKSLVGQHFYSRRLLRERGLWTEPGAADEA